MTIIGDVPWSKSNYNNPLAKSVTRMFDIFGVRYRDPIADDSILGGRLLAGLPVQRPGHNAAGRDGSRDADRRRVHGTRRRRPRCQ